MQLMSNCSVLLCFLPGSALARTSQNMLASGKEALKD
jgi:hypothetical protein